MSTIREFVTKLSTQMDDSGLRSYVDGMVKATKATRMLANELRKLETLSGFKRRGGGVAGLAGASGDSLIKESKSVLNQRRRVGLLAEEADIKRSIGADKIRSIRSTYAAEIRAIRAKAKISRDSEKKSHDESMRLLKAKAKYQVQVLRERGQQRRMSQALNFGGGGGGIGFGGMIGANIVAQGALTGLRTIRDLTLEVGRGFVNAASSIESTRVSFGVLTRSVETGNGMILQMQRLAAETPLTFKSLSENARTMLGYQVPAEKVIDLLKMVGDVTGGSEERMGYMTYALSQVISMTRLQGQELRQLINAGFNPLSEISRTTGRSMEELKQAMENNAISADMVMKAFKSATSEGGAYFKHMEKMATTYEGRLARLKDEVFLAAQDVGATILPVAKSIIDELISFTQGAGRTIGKNVGQTIQPVLVSIIRGFERLGKTLFNFQSIGATLMNKDKLGAFMKNLAKKIDEAFVWISAAVLQLKDFFTKNWDAIAKGFGLIVWGIKTVIENLPLFIKLWAGFKVAGIAASIAGLALKFGQLAATVVTMAASSAGIIAIWGGITAAIVASGLAIEHFIRKTLEVNKLQDRNKRAEALVKEMGIEGDKLKAADDAIKRLKADTVPDMAQQIDFDKLKWEMEEAKKRMLALQEEKNALYKEDVGEESLFEKFQKGIPELKKSISGLFDSVSGRADATPTAFNEALAKAQAVTPSFTINVDSKTDITGNVTDTSQAKDVGTNIGQSIAEAINARFKQQWGTIKMATAY